MRTGTIRILTCAAALVLAGAASAGGGTWISDQGEEHEIGGAKAIFLDEGGEFFDLSDLADGETRVFGSGDRQITASRSGDTISIDRPESDDERPIRIECEVGRDTCKVMTIGEQDQKVALMIKKNHSGHHVMSFDEEVTVGEDGEATIVIEQLADCEEGEAADCIAHENVWIASHVPHHGGHAMMVTGGATTHDLSELYDGETRIFGIGERQVTAVREGDVVRVSRPASDGGEEIVATCAIGSDRCQVLTYDDDPEKVAVVIAKSSACGGGAGECADWLQLHMKEGHPGDIEVIELHGGGSGNVFISSPDGDAQRIHRIKIVTEDEND